MTPDEIRAAHPATYDAIVAIGEQRERQRVCQLLDFGAQGIDCALAHDAIRSGEPLTAELSARFFRDALRRRSIDDRQSECDAAAAAVADTRVTPPGDGRAAVADELERMMGGPRT